MNNLIPITQVKILKNTWIKTKIKYENDMTIYNLLCKLAYETYLLMNTFEDFNIIIDYTSFIDSFIDMIYRSYIIKENIKYSYELDENYDYYDLKYSDQINELFLYFIEMTNYFSVELFNSLNCNYMNLLNFIYQNIEYIDNENYDENTFNDEENYSMFILSKC
tara:strand:+ start:6269 stop:6760 length:492 start_codon:yes stop_codon:yes gene_type:complete